MNNLQVSERQSFVRLHLAGGIIVSPVWSRALPSTPSSVRVYQDAVGDWWASFVGKVESEPLCANGRAIGVDWGVKEIATTTDDADDLVHPEHGKSSQARLALPTPDGPTQAQAWTTIVQGPPTRQAGLGQDLPHRGPTTTRRRTQVG